MIGMAPRRFVIICCIVAASLLSEKAEGKTACGNAKAAVNSKRNIISNGILNVDVSALNRGVKRSVTEEQDDCDQSKKSNIEIKQSAVSAVPGKNEDYSLNEKKSNVKASLDYLVLPRNDGKNKDNSPSRKDKLEKPVKKHSPLWSLSKLIESVDSKGSKKTGISVKSPAKTTEKETSSVNKSEKPDKGIGKTNVASDPTKVIKATLSKAIEKVERVIASKNADLITPAKAEVRSKESADKKNTESTTEHKVKESSTSSASVKSPGKTPIKAAVKDPYAEIAMGPDRPKVPELKSDANNDEGPVMRMSNGEMKPMDVRTSAAFKDSKPLAGQHDVGGLLDRLTDKLNSGGGGVALDTSPLTESNEVKYVQSPMGMDDEGKQSQEFAVDKLKDQADLSEVRKMTESEGLLTGNSGSEATGASANTQSAEDAAAQLLAGASSASSQSPAESPLTSQSESTLTNSLAESALTNSQAESALTNSQAESALTNSQTESALSASSEDSLTGASTASSQAAMTGDDDGIAKTLSKASSLTTDAVMDMLKSSSKVPASDFSNAEISPGPDPYENDETQNDQALGSLLGGTKTNSLNEEAEPTGLEPTTQDAIGGDNSLSEASMQPSDDLSTRSTESESEEEFERNNIPTEDSGSYRNKYNTEMFKKHIIMRPKRDTYVSPFNSREAFDTAI